MFSHLLLLAEVTGHAAAAHGEAASGITKITQDFGISVPFILAQVLNFSVVAILLWLLPQDRFDAALRKAGQGMDGGAPGEAARRPEQRARR